MSHVTRCDRAKCKNIKEDRDEDEQSWWMVIEDWTGERYDACSTEHAEILVHEIDQYHADVIAEVNRESA